MKYPFGSEPNTSVVFPVLSFTFTNEVTLHVPTSCCLSGSAAPADNAAHVRAAAIEIDHSAFMVLPPVFRHVPSMMGSGLAAQPSQSLENIARGTRRSMGQFIPQYRTDGQYWIDHTKTWACVRKRQSAKTLRAIPEVVPGGPTRSWSAILRKPSSEKAGACGARQDSGRWSVRRA